VSQQPFGVPKAHVPLNSDSNSRTQEIRRWPEDAALIITSPDFYPSRVGRRTMTLNGYKNPDKPHIERIFTYPSKLNSNLPLFGTTGVQWT